jgi:hypothetical protein
VIRQIYARRKKALLEYLKKLPYSELPLGNRQEGNFYSRFRKVSVYSVEFIPESPKLFAHKPYGPAARQDVKIKNCATVPNILPYYGEISQNRMINTVRSGCEACPMRRRLRSSDSATSHRVSVVINDARDAGVRLSYLQVTRHSRLS